MQCWAAWDCGRRWGKAKDPVLGPAALYELGQVPCLGASVSFSVKYRSGTG